MTKLLVDLGHACSEYQDGVFQDLPCQRIQCDEIWSFVYAKRKNLPEELQGTFGYGDVWTWVAMDADTKLVPSFMVGERTVEDAHAFMEDLRSRLRHRVQLTTDGFRAYWTAVEESFGADVDYAMLVKLYGEDPQPDKRYSPAICIGAEATVITGDPDPAHIATSFVERQNLTMRMGMRRFTRLTNAFSKKVENLAAAVSLHFMHYNFGRPHKTLSKPYPTTPAMAVGVADHVWTLEEIAGLLD